MRKRIRRYSVSSLGYSCVLSLVTSWAKPLHFQWSGIVVMMRLRISRTAAAINANKASCPKRVLDDVMRLPLHRIASIPFAFPRLGSPPAFSHALPANPTDARFPSSLPRLVTHLFRIMLVASWHSPPPFPLYAATRDLRVLRFVVACAAISASASSVTPSIRLFSAPPTTAFQ